MVDLLYKTVLSKCEFFFLVPNSDTQNKYNFNRTLTAVYGLLSHSGPGRSILDDDCYKTSSITEKYEK